MYFNDHCHQYTEELNYTYANAMSQYSVFGRNFIELKDHPGKIRHTKTINHIILTTVP